MRVDFSKQLNIVKFQESDSWLHAWKGRYNILFKEASGESKSVTPEITATGLIPFCFISNFHF